MNFPDGSKSKKEYLMKNFSLQITVNDALIKAYHPIDNHSIADDYETVIDWSQVNVTNLILHAEKSKPRHQRYLSLYLEHTAVNSMVQLNS